MKTITKFLIAIILICSGLVFAQKTSKIMNTTDFKPGKNKMTYLSSGDKIAAKLFLPTNYKAGKIYPTISCDRFFI